MKKPLTDRFNDFMAGRGFYIVLFLCVAAIGISGYYLFSSLAGEGPAADVSGPAQVVVTPEIPVGQEITPDAPDEPVMIEPVRPSVSPMKPTPMPDPPAVKTVVPAAPVSKPATPTVYTWPVKGAVLDAFSPDRQRYDVTMGDWRTHAGIDIAAETGTPVKAAAKGTVHAVESDDLLGTVLTIDHGNGLVSVYANLGEQPTVAVGDKVSAGDILGAVGTTAKGESSQAAHLHLAFYKDEKPADPMKYLPTP